jgi:hypothetical protein
MNGLTTIAALPTAGGCKAELSADKSKANTPTYAVGALLKGADLASAPDLCSIAMAHRGKVIYSFTVGDVASVEVVEQVRKQMANRRHFRGW